jgi:hypothetical protein
MTADCVDDNPALLRILADSRIVIRTTPHVLTKPVEHEGRVRRELTRTVDLTCDPLRACARLLELVPAYKTWLTDLGEAFQAGVRIATLDPVHGYKNAIDENFENARAARSGRQRSAGRS